MTYHNSHKRIEIIQYDAFMKQPKQAGKGVKASVPKSQSSGSLKEAASPPKSINKPAGLSVYPGVKKATPAPVEDVKTALVASLSVDEITEFLSMDELSRLLKVESFLLADDISKSSAALVKIIESCGITSVEGSLIASKMIELVKSANPVDRENGLHLAVALFDFNGRAIEPYILTVTPNLFRLFGDRSTSVRELAGSVVVKYANSMCPNALRLIFPTLLDCMGDDDWKIRVGALNFIKSISSRMAKQISALLPQLIPKATDCIYDNKKQVQYAAIEALNEACSGISNDDIRPLVPQLVSVIAHPEESIKTLDLLLETTFVATVDSPVLALIAPLLGKSLKSQQTSLMKRKASRVIDIMCRLVQDPRDVAPFMPLLLPALEKVIDEIADAEVCSVAEAAREILINAYDGKIVVEGAKPPINMNLELAEVGNSLSKIFADIVPKDASATIFHEYIIQIVSQLVVYATQANTAYVVDKEANVAKEPFRYAVAMTTRSEWRDCIVPYVSVIQKKRLTASDDDDNEAVTSNLASRSPEALSSLFRTAALGDIIDNDLEASEDEANVCDIEFSLAFGGKILLHNTRLRLGKGRKYGLMGKNGAGKTTLLTNIGSGNIEGLPPHLTMVYVQHDDASDDFGRSIIDEIMDSKELVKANVTREAAIKALKDIHFTDDMIASPRSALSGGWKMKLLITKAMLSKADVLLLDEPTNHLDQNSVRWLTNYIQSLKDATCLVVSHDTKFMDAILTDVIHYENRKLVYYHGNLTHFVEIHPEAKYYYELESDLTFKFPTPERLDGINSTTRSIIKMDNITFTYPGATKPTLFDVSVKVCLASRIAILGANGAGKSTLVKLLVQETEPDEGSGEIWKHMNLRVAYVAQHSFHHIEQHLDVSPVDYMKWRFAGGVDKEEFLKPTKKLTDEELAEFKSTSRKYGDVDQCIGRRKYGRTMEYECTWVGQNHPPHPRPEPNKYIPLEQMIAMGYGKLVQQCDAKIAAMAAGLDVRPLLTAEIQSHLDDFNLDAEFGTYGTIKRLSGGQKVKLVLAAAMWNRPHVIILDEPTNYLDRQALGALTQAIKGFAGGVVIISHNKEFTEALCTEEWLVKEGRCFTKGGAEETALTAVSSRAMKRCNSNPEMKEKPTDDVASGNTNATIASEVILNPRTLEGLSKKETRKLERCAQVAGVSLKEYVSKITCKSPEWKWL